MLKKGLGVLLKIIPNSSVKIFEFVGFRMLNAASIKHFMPDLDQAPALGNRRGVWQFVIDTIGENTPVAFFEFGVWKGESIAYFARKFQNSECSFFGFDSFEGLPEDWEGLFRKTSRGAFSTQGTIPEIEDPRLEFVKGYFQDTLLVFREKLLNKSLKQQSTVIIHLDADLYSSTSYVLYVFAQEFDEFYFICDEWCIGESLAMMEFANASGYEIEFLGKHINPSHGLPVQVFGKARRLNSVEARRTTEATRAESEHAA